MDRLYTFMGEHPVVTVLIVWAVCQLISTTVQQPFRIFNRHVRSRNILAHGWPKAPVDADGDVVYPKDIEA